MIYSVSCQHAIQALTRLVQLTPHGGFCLLRQMTDPDGLPEPFVGKLMQALVRADILISAKGRNGGFALRGSPSEVSLREIVEAIDGPGSLERCIVGMGECDDDQPCPHHEYWKPIRRQVMEVMERTSLADLVESIGKKTRRRR